MQVGIILSDFAPQVVSHRDPNLKVISAQEVIADAVTRADKRNVTVIDIQVWATLYPVRARTVISRLHLRCESQYCPKSWQIGLK